MANWSPACCLCRSVTKSQRRTPGRLPAPHSRLPQDEEARTCGGFRTGGWGPHSASFVLLFRPVGGLPRESVCPGLAPVHGASRSCSVGEERVPRSHFQPGGCGRQHSGPKDVPVIMAAACEHVTLRGKKDFADVIN